MPEPNYSQIDQQLTQFERDLLPQLQQVFADVKDKTQSLVDRRSRSGGLDFKFVNGLELRGLGDLVPLLRGYLHQVYEAGRGAARAETEAKSYVEVLPPRQAINYFENKALTWKGIVADELLAQIKRVLLGSLTLGAPLGTTQKSLERVFAPYVGDLAALPDQEQLQPYRLETLIRTNTTEAYNQGRKAMLVEDPGIKGFRYSAILDTRTCFFKGTMVQMSSGREVPIECISPGDIITSGAGKSRRVLRVVRYKCREWRDIEFSNGSSVRCTPTHPFWTFTPGTGFSWEEARILKSGNFCTTIKHASEENNSKSCQNLLPLWKGVCSNSLSPQTPDFLLLPAVLLQLQASSKDLRKLRKKFQNFPVSCPEKFNFGPFLFHELLQICNEEGLSACPAYSKMSSLWEGISLRTQHNSSGHRADPLFKSVSDAKGYEALSCLQKLFYFSYNGKSDLLLTILLSAIKNGDTNGGDGSSRTPGSEDSFYLGDAYWEEVVSRFRNSSLEVGDRGQWDILAPRSSRSEEVQKIYDSQETRLGGFPARSRQSIRPSPAFSASETNCSVIPKAQALLKVESVKTFYMEDWAYDVQMGEDHSYLVSGGIIVHNTPVCRFLHGKYLPPAGETLERLTPPRHHNCRSLLVPVFSIPSYISDGEVDEAVALSGRDFADAQPARTYGDLVVVGGPMWEVEDV